MAIIAGTQQTSFFEDFYNRIYLDPPEFDYQVISKTTSISGQIWNAHFFPVILEDIYTTSIDDDSVVVSPEGTMPITIPALKVQPTKITVNKGGDSNVEGHAAYSFDTGEMLQLKIDGVRGVPWPFAPNWNSSYTQEFTFVTEIITSRSGREQRIASRENARKTVEFTSHVKADDRRTLNALLDNYQDVAYILADLPRFVKSVEAVPADDTPFEVESIPPWLQVNDLVVVTNRRQQLVRRVFDIDNTNKTITFRDSLGPAFPAGSHICFAFVGYLADTINTKRLTNDVAEIKMNFEAMPGAERDPVLPAPDVVYAGYEVLTVRPDWAEPVSFDFNKQTIGIDFGRGVVTRFNPVAYATRLFKMTFTNKNTEQTKKITDMFLRAKGQQGEFIIPTWENDIIPGNLTYFGGASSSITIAGSDFYDTWRFNKTMRHIAVITQSGRIIIRGIYPIELVGGNSTIYLTEMLPYDFDNNPGSADPMIMICWAPIYRFATDNLQIEWLTDTKAQIQTTFRSLEYQPAEIL